jgi:hypothetical protein
MHALLDNALGRSVRTSGGAESIASGGDEAEAEALLPHQMLCDSDGVVSNSQRS